MRILRSSLDPATPAYAPQLPSPPLPFNTTKHPSPRSAHGDAPHRAWRLTALRSPYSWSEDEEVHPSPRRAYSASPTRPPPGSYATSPSVSGMRHLAAVRAPCMMTARDVSACPPPRKLPSPRPFSPPASLPLPFSFDPNTNGHDVPGRDGVTVSMAGFLGSRI